MLSPALAGTVTHEVVQLADQALLNVDLKNETLNLEAAAQKLALAEEVVETAEINQAQEQADEEKYDEEDYYEDDDQKEYEEDQGAEAYSTTVSSPAVRVADVAGSDLGEPQVIDSIVGDEVKALISDARIYINDSVNKLPEYEKVRDLCFNKHANCAFWAGTLSISFFFLLLF